MLALRSDEGDFDDFDLDPITPIFQPVSFDPTPSTSPYPPPQNFARRAASRRGGRRPGAGAPRGNLNALKTGAHSRQVQALSLALSLVPEAREALARLSRRAARKQKRAEATATLLLRELLRTSLDRLDSSLQPEINQSPDQSTKTARPARHERPLERDIFPKSIRPSGSNADYNQALP